VSQQLKQKRKIVPVFYMPGRKLNRQLKSWKRNFLANDYNGIAVGHNSSLKL